MLLVVAKINKLDIDFVETPTPITPEKDKEYLKLNPLARVPTFVGSDGFLLTEVIAIALYCASAFLLCSYLFRLYPNLMIVRRNFPP